MGIGRDPLHWWPGKYADCKRIAQLVAEILPSGHVLQYGGMPLFKELLPDHRVTRERLQTRAQPLPYADDHFDVGISARVLELVPRAMWDAYLAELVRVSRYCAFIAIPLQPELEIIDKLKNPNVWDTSRLWAHPCIHPEELDALLARHSVHVDLHVEAAPDIEGAAVHFAALESPAGTPGFASMPFLIAEVVKQPIHAFPAAVSAVLH